jgi:hypothetical protein
MGMMDLKLGTYRNQSSVSMEPLGFPWNHQMDGSVGYVGMKLKLLTGKMKT